MATRRQKVEAGLFLLIGAALLFVVIFLLIQLHVTEEWDRYNLEFYESVGNLKENSPVRYKGYPVGHVCEYMISDEMSHIIVKVHIKKGTRLTTDVRAELKYNPLTQVYFIELTREGNGEEVLKPGLKILTKPSNIDQIVDRIPELQASLAALMQQFTTLVSNENISTFGKILVNLEGVIDSVPAKLDHLEGEAVDLRNEIKGTMDVFAERMEGTLDLIDETVVEIKAMATRFEKVGDGAETMIARSAPAVESLLADLGEAVVESKSLVLDLRRVAAKLDENPSRLVWSDREKVERILGNVESTVKEARTLLRELRQDPSRAVWSERTPARKTPDPE